MGKWMRGGNGGEGESGHGGGKGEGIDWMGRGEERRRGGVTEYDERRGAEGFNRVSRVLDVTAWRGDECVNTGCSLRLTVKQESPKKCS